MAYKKIFLLLIALSLSTQKTQSYFNNFYQTAKAIDENISYEQFMILLNDNYEELQKDCKNVTIALFIWHDDIYDKHKWGYIKKYFSEQKMTFDTLNTISSSQKMKSLPEEPFKALTQICVDTNNTKKQYFRHKKTEPNIKSFGLFLSVSQDISDDEDDDESIDLIVDEDHCCNVSPAGHEDIGIFCWINKETWKQVFSVTFAFSKKFTSKSDLNDLLKYCCPKIAKIAESIDKSDGIYFSIETIMYAGDGDNVRLGYDSSK